MGTDLIPPHNDSVQIIVDVDKREISWLVGLLDSYGDLAVVRTLDASRGRIELLCSPDYLDHVRSLLHSLEKEMPIRIVSEPQRD